MGQVEKHCWGNFSFSIERSRNTFEIETRIGYCCRNRLSAEWSLTKVFPFGRPMRLIEDASSGCGKIKNANVSVPSTLQHFSSFMNSWRFSIRYSSIFQRKMVSKSQGEIERISEAWNSSWRFSWRFDRDSRWWIWKDNGLQEFEYFLIDSF